MPNIRLAHPELSPNAAAAAAKVSPEIRELIKRSGKKPGREYTLGEEIFNAVTHGVGAGLAVAALVLLIVKSVSDGGGILLAAALVYGIAQLLEYLMSTLYHALAAERAKRVFKVLDHSGIYLLIAGTYTPYCLITLGHVGGVWLAASGPSHLSASPLKPSGPTVPVGYRPCSTWPSAGPSCFSFRRCSPSWPPQASGS